MKITNIIGLVLVLIAFGVIGYYINEVSAERWAYWDSIDYNNYNYSSYSSYGEATMEAALAMIPFTLFFIFAYIWNMIKIKTMTTRVFTIIGLSFSLIIVLINLLVFVEPTSASFDESGGFFIFYHIINLAFFIVLLVQSVRYENRNNEHESQADILDFEII